MVVVPELVNYCDGYVCPIRLNFCDMCYCYPEETYRVLHHVDVQSSCLFR